MRATTKLLLTIAVGLSLAGCFQSAREQSAATAAARIAKPAAGMRIVAKWATVHTAAAALGMIRPPAILNRHGRKQPGWENVDAAPADAENTRESMVPGSPTPSSLFG